MSSHNRNFQSLSHLDRRFGTGARRTFTGRTSALTAPIVRPAGDDCFVPDRYRDYELSEFPEESITLSIS